eukprot:SAG22_NODE_1607_length_4009_cov_16.741432_2_plen_216_part_00
MSELTVTQAPGQRLEEPTRTGTGRQLAAAEARLAKTERARLERLVRELQLQFGAGYDIDHGTERFGLVDAYKALRAVIMNSTASAVADENLKSLAYRGKWTEANQEKIVDIFLAIHSVPANRGLIQKELIGADFARGARARACYSNPYSGLRAHARNSRAIGLRSTCGAVHFGRLPVEGKRVLRKQNGRPVPKIVKTPIVVYTPSVNGDTCAHPH